MEMESEPIGSTSVSRMPESKRKSYQRTPYTAQDVRGTLGVCFLVLGAIYYAYRNHYDQLGFTNPRFQSIADRLFYTLRLEIFAVIPIFVSIHHVLYLRITNPLVHNPLQGNEHITELANRILTNTIEQYVFHLANILIFASIIPETLNYLIRFIVFCYVFGRFLYFIGYQVHPKYRGCGFIFTLTPTTVVFFYNLIKVLKSF